MLTDPEPATLLSRTRQWLAAGAGQSSSLSATPRATFDRPVPARLGRNVRRQRLPGGHSLHDAIDDPMSLAKVRDSVVGRGRRGIELPATQARRPGPRRPGDGVDGGRHPPAHRGIADVRRRVDRSGQAASPWRSPADPARSALFRAKLDALQGVAALRRGEIENCVACCNESSCIFPLAAAAVHRRTAGSREAIEHFTRYLRQQPDDLGVQWLLNVAYMTLGEYPTGVPPSLLLPLGRFAASRDDRRRMVNVASRVGLNARGESMAGGCLVDDFDGDGLLDVFMPTTDPERGALLLHNRGDGTFRGRL